LLGTFDQNALPVLHADDAPVRHDPLIVCKQQVQASTSGLRHRQERVAVR